MPSAPMLAHLSQNVTCLIPVWKMVATDTTVAAYCAHTRNLAYNGTNYSATPVVPTRFSQSLGLNPNNIELFGVFDSVIDEDDIQGGKWKNAQILFEFIVIDIQTGLPSATITDSVGKIKGQAGKFTINNGTFTVELQSLSALVNQPIGELTSPVDRNRRPEDLGVSMAPFTHARTVTAVVNRMNFTVGGTAQADNYFQYGRAEWTGGANNGLKMEVKASVGNAIELQLPMRSNITVGDTVTLIAGYDGTIEQARDKFGAGEKFNGEFMLPGLRGIVKYPE